MRKHFAMLAAAMMLLAGPMTGAASVRVAKVAGRMAGAASVRMAMVAAPARPEVRVIELHDTMQPERADLLRDSLDRARRDHVAAVMIDLSSPGGMPDATDRMVATIQASRVPVIVWAGAGNSRVTGQALRLMAAADVSLMTPSAYLTPLWTETPRGLTAAWRAAGTRELELGLSTLLVAHGRNASAVDELSGGIHWFTAKEALQAGVIDGVAEKQTDVLKWVAAHGYRRAGVVHELNIANGRQTVDGVAPQSELLVALMNPNLCVLLLTLGLLLIYLEINTPGVVIPGAVGLLLTLLSVYALSRQTLTAHGVVLCVGAIALLLGAAHVRAHGVVAGAGILCLVVGLGRLVEGPLPQLQVNWGTAIGAGLGFGGITAGLMLLGAEARRAKVRTGAEAMLGWLAVAHTPLTPEGQILVRGELWRARMTSNDGNMVAGGQVKVLRADGRTLEVTAVPMATSN